MKKRENDNAVLHYDDVQKIQKMFDDYYHTTGEYISGIYCVTDDGIYEKESGNIYAHAEGDKNDYRIIKGILPFNNIYKFVISGSRSYLDHVQDIIPQQFFEDYNIMFAADTNLEICAKLANKGTGVQILSDALNIPTSDMAAVGDAAADISMLKAVKFGVAMGNATLEVKQVADLITSSNNSDGIAYMLRQLIN